MDARTSNGKDTSEDGLTLAPFAAVPSALITNELGPTVKPGTSAVTAVAAAVPVFELLSILHEYPVSVIPACGTGATHVKSQVVATAESSVPLTLLGGFMLSPSGPRTVKSISTETDLTVTPPAFVPTALIENVFSPTVSPVTSAVVAAAVAVPVFELAAILHSYPVSVMPVAGVGASHEKSHVVREDESSAPLTLLGGLISGGTMLMLAETGFESVSFLVDLTSNRYSPSARSLNVSDSSVAELLPLRALKPPGPPDSSQS